jgi:hypothetical protein
MPPMMFFAVRIEHAFNTAVQCPHDANPREHRRSARCRDQDQGFHRSLPFLGFVLGLRKLRDIGAGVFERYELAPLGSEIGSSNFRDQSAVMRRVSSGMRH